MTVLRGRDRHTRGASPHPRSGSAASRPRPLSIVLAGALLAALALAAPAQAIDGRDVKLHFRRLLYQHCSVDMGVDLVQIQVYACKSVSIVSCSPTGYNQRKKAQWACVGLVESVMTSAGRLIAGGHRQRDCHVVAGFNPWGRVMGSNLDCFDAALQARAGARRHGSTPTTRRRRA